jgi:Flp pilus assembly protein TadD
LSQTVLVPGVSQLAATLRWARPASEIAPGKNTAAKGDGDAVLSRHQRAIEVHDEAVRLEPQRALVYVNRAVACTHFGKDNEAQQDGDRAVELGIDRGTADGWIEKAKKQR